MIEHLVLFKFKDNTEKHCKIDMLNKLNELKSHISEIKEISCGENFTNRSQGYGFGLRVLFESEEDLESYLVHPAHVRVVDEVIKPIITDLLVLDYKI